MVLAMSKSAPVVQEEEVSHDPVLQHLATTDTFDSDWPTLRHHMHLALLSALPIFKSRPAPAPYQFPPDTPSRPSNAAAGSDTSSPLSTKAPNSPFASTSSVPPSSSLLLSRSPSSSTSPLSAPAPDEQPSTLGGLVIPPFPPLDPERRNNRRLSAASIGPVPPAVVARMNGHQGGGQAAALARGNVFEDDWDEAVVIGGKKMPGWLDDEEGRKEVERVGKLIDELPEPPFTIQRLAELLLNPTKHHTTLGKFLRALEKNLLVTTPWTAPSYIAVPPSTFSGSRGLFGPTSSPTSLSSASSPDSSSTMPIGSTTPMFSPIPFLVRPSTDTESGMDIDSDAEVPGGSAEAGRGRDELMSPLVLDNKELAAEPRAEAAANAVLEPTPSATSPTSSSATAGRSQTPEPEEVSSRPQPTSPSQPLPTSETPSESVLTGSESSDPAHQPYLGRVDELDTGPIVPQPHSDSGSNSSGSSGGSGSSGNGLQEEGSGMGTGEGGNMTPHGMSERPVPISATTVVEASEGERKVAGLPRTKSMLSLAEGSAEKVEEETADEVVEGKGEEGQGAKKAKIEGGAGGVAAPKQDGEVESKKEEEGSGMDVDVEEKVKEGEAAEKVDGQ